MQSIVITPTDQQAQIWVDGAYLGKGTQNPDLRRNRAHSIMAKVGDQTGTAIVGSTISTTGVLDIIGGVLFLIPLVGMLGPGFYSLDTDSVVVAIPPPSER